MSKAGELVERMARLNGAAGPPPPAPAAPAAGGDRARRPVRFTVDLDPELHRSLRIFALERRVDATAVARALLELLGDELVSRAVIERLDSAP